MHPRWSFTAGVAFAQRITTTSSGLVRCHSTAGPPSKVRRSGVVPPAKGVVLPWWLPKDPAKGGLQVRVRPQVQVATEGRSVDGEQLKDDESWLILPSSVGPKGGKGTVYGAIAGRLASSSMEDGAQPARTCSPAAEDLRRIVAARVDAAFELRRRVAVLPVPHHDTVFRAIHGEADHLPGCFVDVFGHQARVRATSTAAGVSLLPHLHAALAARGLQNEEPSDAAPKRTAVRDEPLFYEGGVAYASATGHDVEARAARKLLGSVLQRACAGSPPTNSAPSSSSSSEGGAPYQVLCVGTGNPRNRNGAFLLTAARTLAEAAVHRPFALRLVEGDRDVCQRVWKTLTLAANTPWASKVAGQPQGLGVTVVDWDGAVVARGGDSFEEPPTDDARFAAATRQMRRIADAGDPLRAALSRNSRNADLVIVEAAPLTDADVEAALLPLVVSAGARVAPGGCLFVWCSGPHAATMAEAVRCVGIPAMARMTGATVGRYPTLASVTQRGSDFPVLMPSPLQVLDDGGTSSEPRPLVGGQPIEVRTFPLSDDQVLLKKGTHSSSSGLMIQFS